MKKVRHRCSRTGRSPSNDKSTSSQNDVLFVTASIGGGCAFFENLQHRSPLFDLWHMSTTCENVDANFPRQTMGLGSGITRSSAPKMSRTGIASEAMLERTSKVCVPSAKNRAPIASCVSRSSASAACATVALMNGFVRWLSSATSSFNQGTMLASLFAPTRPFMNAPLTCGPKPPKK